MVIRRPRRLLLASVVALSVAVAGCSNEPAGDGASAPKPRTASTPPPSLAADVDAASSGSHVTARAGAPGGKQAGTRPSASPPVALDAPGAAGTPTTAGTSPPSTSTTAPPGLPPERCPDAKTCRRYVFVNGAGVDASRAPRWPVGGDGVAVVRYHVNPFGSGLAEEDVRGGIERAFETITRAAPTLRFEFAGFTDRLPTPGDGRNDIGFSNASSAHATPTSKGTTMTEADMILAAGPGKWTWSPCEQRDGACTPVCVRNSTGAGCRVELQSLVTHEGLHWAGLDDMADEETDRELSASPSGSLSDRFRSTLALGDVLGLRALYPCSCPLPPIYAP